MSEQPFLMSKQAHRMSKDAFLGFKKRF